MKFDRRLLLATTVLAGFVAAPAFAQTQDQAQTQPAAEEADVQEVVVTGSRIRRTEFSSPAPIQVLRAEEAVLSGVADSSEFLQSSTLAAGSPQVNAIISSAFVTDGGPGAATISLRGLGANRTLVLLNGRRAGPAGVRGAVSSFDLNVLPISAIDRVEILKDGASSVYGSDAVAGVVNIITKSNLDGGLIDVYATQPLDAGGEQYRASGSWGRTFDRGSFSATFDVYRQNELKIGDRGFLNCAQQYVFNPTTGARTDLVDPRTGAFACRDTLWGHVWLYDYTGEQSLPPGAKLQFDYDGNLGSFIPRRPAGYPTPADGWWYLDFPTGWYLVDYQIGDDTAPRGVANANHPFIAESSLIPQVDRATVFLNGSFDISNNIEAYGEVLLNRRESRTNGFRQFWSYLYTETWGDPFSAGFTGEFLLSPTAITDHFDAKQRVDYARVVGGLRGQLPDFGLGGGWTWDLFTQLSRSDGRYTQDVILDDAVWAANFRSGSCVGTNLPVSGKPCIDINWLNPEFLRGNFTQAERDFLFDRETGQTIYEQVVVEGAVTGDLFRLPAGMVGGAFGFHLRRDRINDTPGEITLADNSWGLSGAGVTRGKDTTREFFGELELPLLRGLPMAENVTLSISGRYTDVDSYGDNTTYKAGLNWQMTPAWRLRATQGTSFRAPALFELYLADQTSFLGQRSIDPCINWSTELAAGRLSQRVADNCAADGVPGNHTGAGSSATIVTGGGAGILEAETSKARTVGLIWTPRFIDLSVAVDYFEIEVNNQVTQLGAGNIVRLCYASDTFPTDPLCAQFDRNPGTNLISEVRDSFINIASQKNRGIDLTTRYRHELPWGSLTLNGQFTWQLEDTIALFAGNTVDSNGSVGDPDFVGSTSARFDRGDWTYFWSVDMIGKGSDAEYASVVDVTATQRRKVHTEFTSYHSLSVRKRHDDWTFLAGMANVFDETPPNVTPGRGVYSTSGTAVLASQYDYLGRRVFVNISRRF